MNESIWNFASDAMLHVKDYGESPAIHSILIRIQFIKNTDAKKCCNLRINLE